MSTGTVADEPVLAVVTENDYFPGRHLRPALFPMFCPICGARLSRKPLYCSSFSMKAGRRLDGETGSTLWLCGCCQYLFRVDDHSSEDALRYFDGTDYVSQQNEEFLRWTKQGMFEEVLRRTARHFHFRDQPGTMVDFGCSYGHLGLVFQRAGWRVAGVDIAESIRQYHHERGTFPVYERLECPQIPDGSVDVIAMIDVLCCISNPLDLLSVAYRKLAEPGVVVLRIPNRTRYIRWGVRLQRFLPDLVSRWEYDYSSFWTTRNIKMAARQAGFNDCRIFRRESGYRYPPARKLFHWITQLLAAGTGGVIDLATVFQGELWKGRPPVI
ncbi:MAG: class I SAM-dependent methyltransferase [Bacillota bacterium]